MSEDAISKRPERFYEFDGFQFRPKERLLIRVRDGHAFKLTPKPNALLLALLKRRGEIVTYDELRREVWPDTAHVLAHTVRETKHAVVKVLGESSGKLETVAGKGYRFNVDVIERLNEGNTSRGIGGITTAVANNTGEPETLTSLNVEPEISKVGSEISHAPARVIDLRLRRPFAGHYWHVAASCALYALLYSIAVLVEIAYQYDRLGASALKIAPFVFLWIFATSAVGLGVAWRCVLRGESRGLILSLSIISAAGLLLYVALGLFLPKSPITEANFQTYTAHGAYLKSVCYFLFLAVVFLTIPFHFVLTLEKEVEAGRGDDVLKLLSGERLAVAPEGAIYLKAWWLGLMLFAVTVVSPALLAHLFENLRPRPQTNFFTQLVLWRTLLYLGLCFECLLWYYRSVNNIRRMCMAADRATRVNAEAPAE